MKARDLLNQLENLGFNFFSGVPCSYLKPFCRLLQEKETADHVAAPREDIALGLAAGAYMAGKLPLVYMQNSGLGYSLEVFTSLHLVYRIPVLVLLSYRGPADAGWEEHEVMGRHTEELLQTFRIPYATIDGSFTAGRLADACRKMLSDRAPFFLLAGKESLS